MAGKKAHCIYIHEMVCIDHLWMKVCAEGGMRLIVGRTFSGGLRFIKGICLQVCVHSSLNLITFWCTKFLASLHMSTFSIDFNTVL